MCSTVDSFYASIECTFLKTREICILSMKMVLFPCINIVYR